MRNQQKSIIIKQNKKTNKNRKTSAEINGINKKTTRIIRNQWESMKISKINKKIKRYYKQLLEIKKNHYKSHTIIRKNNKS